MSKFTVRKRLTEWWREPGETNEKTPLQEAYDPSRLKPGSDGLNTPKIEKMYATSNYGSPGGLGSGKKTSKGGASKFTTKTEKKIQSSKRVKEAYDEEEDEMPMDMDTSDQDMDMEVDFNMGDGDDDLLLGSMDGEGDEINDESEIPPEIDDLSGDTSLASDVKVTIGGKEYMLVPVGDEDMEGPSEMDTDEELGPEEDLDSEDDLDSDMPDEEPMGDDEIESEDDDISQPKKESLMARKKRLAAKRSNLKVKEDKRKEKIAKALNMVKQGNKILSELFTGEYVQNKGEQKNAGFNFSDVRGDTDFAVVARAASGKQYTPSKSSGDQEKNKEKKEALKKKSKISHSIREGEPGQDAENFNRNDTLGNNIGDVEKFPEIPETLGADPDTISQYKRTAETRKKRAQRFFKEVEDVVPPETTVEGDDYEESDTMNESFSYKDFLAGRYNK